jgi:selenide,water dikinase
LAERGLVKAATDITGFGLVGHLANLVRGSGVLAEITAGDVPVLGREIAALVAQDCVPGGSRANLEAADELVDWGRTPEATRIVLSDAQTSGGLLLCVAPRKLSDVMAVLKRNRTACAAVIGRIRRGGPRIIVAGQLM